MTTSLIPSVAAQFERGDWRIVVTGASGWLGMATLELLHNLLGKAVTSHVACFGRNARTLTLPGGQQIAQRPLAELANLPARPTLLLHYAFLTKEKAEELTEPAYRAANAEIARVVEEALLTIDARGIFIASSGAAYFAEDPTASAAMRLYGEMKRDDEDRFATWGTACGRRVVIGRVFNISGRYINKLGSYALANFVVDAMAGRPVAVKAPHRVERAMVDVTDVINLLFAELLASTSGVARFETGGDAMELGELAAVVAAELRARGSVKRAPITSARVDRYVGDDTVWQRACTAHGIQPATLLLQIRQTAEFLAETANYP